MVHVNDNRIMGGSMMQILAGSIVQILMTAIGFSGGLALAAAGITLIYMTTGTFSFAHASMTAWGFYIVFSLYKVMLGGNPYFYFPVAFLFSGLLGIITYVVVNRWLLRRGADMVTLMMSTLGVDLVFFAFINIFADFLTATYKVNSRLIVLTTEDVVLGKIGTFSFKAITLVSVIIVIGTALFFYYLLNKTKFGIAFRVTVENPALAAIIGINTEVIYLVAWFLGGALAGLGGAVLSMVISGTPTVGNTVIVPEFAASIVGGLYSLYGGLLGGFLIGLSQKIIINWLGSILGGNVAVYEPIIPLIIMAATLLLYPQGLGGINWEKVFSKLRGEKR